MNSSVKRTSLAVALLVFLTLAVAAADNKKPAAPASHPAPAAHPAAKPAGGGASHPGGAAGNATHVNNQHSGAGGANGAAHGNNTTGHPGGNNAGHPGGNTNAGHPGGNNAGHPGGNNAGHPGGNNAGHPGGNAQGAANRHEPAGTKSVALKGGGQATFRKNGQVRSVQAHGVAVSRGLTGHRNIVATHNGRTVVARGRAGGYTQRAYYRRGNTVYVQRTYVYGGRSYACAYRSYYYGGYPYYGYAPAYYYGPAYYGWAYNPWPAPVYYGGWGWGGSPWYGYYGAYYQPYPVYPSAAFWLTDFFVGAALQAAYASQAAAAAENGTFISPEASENLVASLWTSDALVSAKLGSTYPVNLYMLGAAAPAAPTMTKEVKDAISEEIKDQIAAEKEAAAAGNNAPAPTGPPAALDPKIRYFVVADEQDLTTADGTECALTGGDVVYRTGDTPDDDKMVDATVKSSQKGECAVGATVGVSADDLQEMYNNMRQHISEGMKEMAANSGKNGLPTAPDTKTTAGEVPAPAADPSVSDDLQKAQTDADQAEAEAKQQSN